MKLGLPAFVVAFILSILPSAAQAALDLADDAFVRVSAVEDVAGILADQSSGASAIHDNDLDTFWHPPVGAEAWIEFDLSTRREPIDVELRSVSIHWKGKTSRSVKVYVGPDRFALYPVLVSSVISSDALNLYLPKGYNRTRYLKIEFQPGDFNVAEVEVFALDSGTFPSVPSALSLAISGRNLRISWAGDSTVHHFEINRSADGVLQEYYYSTALFFLSDRPRKLSDYTYSIRSVAYDGRASDWVDFKISKDDLLAYNPASLDYPVIKGVVEGFYGQPWKHRTRIEVLHRMSLWGMNTYLYAPKQDAKHHLAWRSFYNENDLARFAELNEFALRRNIAFVYGISPGNDIDPLDDDDFSDLQKKLQTLYDIGIRRFALLMDDISSSGNGATGDAHTFLVNRLNDWLCSMDSKTRLMFVPTVYSGVAESLNDDQRDYLSALADIDPAVSVLWTGQDVFNPEISGDESRGIAALIGRKPLVWDNYPVNDYALAQTLHLAAIEGRDDEMLASVEGLLVNPMVEGAASLFALASYGELFDNPYASYSSSDAWMKAVDGLSDDLSFKEWRILVSVFSINNKIFPGRDELPKMNDLIDDFVLAVNLYNESEAMLASVELLDELYAYYSLSLKVMDKVLSNSLYEELYYRMEKLGVLSEKAILAVNLILSDIYGIREDFETYENRLDSLPDVLAWQYVVADDTFRRLTDELKKEGRKRRFSASGRFEAIIARPMPNARIGQKYVCDLGFNMMSGCKWSLMSDFKYSINSEGILSFTPQAAGSERVMAVCRRDGTVVSFPFEIETGPALNSLDSPTLEPSSELERFGPVTALVQNGVIYPESGYSPMSKSRILGPWTRMRAALDHRLSFAARSKEIVSLLEWESHGAVMPEYDDSQWDKVYMPQPENMLASPYHASGHEKYYGGVWYRVKTRLPSSAPGTRLAFSAGSYILDVWAEGLYLGWHEGAYTPAYFELPDELLSKDEISLVVRIDHPEHGTYPGMLGPSAEADYFSYAGLVQDVNWEYYPSGQKASINFAAMTPLSLSGKMRLDLILEERIGREFNGRIKVQAYVTDPKKSGYLDSASPGGIAREETPLGGDKNIALTLSPGQVEGYRLEPTINQAKSWNPWKPVIYILRISLYETSGADDKKEDDDILIDRYVTQVGFRLLSFDKFGRMQLNNKVPFLPSFTYYEDRPYVGMQADWEAYKSDFNWMRAYGARMVRLGGYPHHHYSASLADRIGMALMVEVPVNRLSGEGLNDISRRGIALQAWRETIFANYNRPSVLFWGACDSCYSSGAELKDFISLLHNDLDENYADGRLVTQSAAAPDYFKGVKQSFDSVDIVGISSFYGSKYAAGGQGIAASVNDLIYRISQDWPDKPIIMTAYGAGSGLLGTAYSQQNLAASKTWEGVSEFLQVNKKRTIIARPGILSMSWASMGDGFSNVDGIRTLGAFGMDRYTRKPLADILSEYHAPYKRSSYTSNESEVVVQNRKDSQDCSQSPDGAGILLILLMLGLYMRKGSSRRV